MIGAMDRAAVLIGVNRTGGLPPLQDAARSARRMERWALAQGMQPVTLITDDDGRTVDVASIKQEIKTIANLGTVEQLIVFFAGHGINKAFGEWWLLTDAPADGNAAVNVRGSTEAARFGRIPYVVMISDACRTAAQTIQSQAIEGSLIFPIETIPGAELPVDLFYACGLGNSAYEVADGEITAKEYKALYTRVLVSALEGAASSVLDPQGYVRPWPLKAYLITAMASELRDLQLQTKLIQVPDAHISSPPTAWIARISGPPPADGEPADGEPPGGEPAGGEPATPGPDGQDVPTVPGALSRMLRPLLVNDQDDFETGVDETSGSQEPRIADLAAAVRTTAMPFGPTRFETRCGIKVRGAQVVNAMAAPGTRIEQLSDEVVRVYPRRPGTAVLLELDNHLGVAFPAIRDFITAITLEGDEVVDVAYEPSEGTGRWQQFKRREREIRSLRAVAASSSRQGLFGLEGEDALAVAGRMQYAKGVDPALAIYAAYAYIDQGRRDLVREMYGFMERDLGGVLFDVAMLARSATDDLFGLGPLLAQGWALLPASRIELPERLEHLAAHVLSSSLWTIFDLKGVELVREAIQRREVR
jgi:hypothetical protein